MDGLINHLGACEGKAPRLADLYRLWPPFPPALPAAGSSRNRVDLPFFQEKIAVLDTTEALHPAAILPRQLGPLFALALWSANRAPCSIWDPTGTTKTADRFPRAASAASGPGPQQEKPFPQAFSAHAFPADKSA